MEKAYFFGDESFSFLFGEIFISQLRMFSIGYLLSRVHDLVVGVNGGRLLELQTKGMWLLTSPLFHCFLINWFLYVEVRGSRLEKLIKKTYEELCKIFIEHDLKLDEIIDTKNISRTQKLNCHCVKHPNLKMNLSYSVVSSGRFGCPNCSKAQKRQNLTIEEKIQLIEDLGFHYVDGDLTSILTPITIKCNNNHKFMRSINNLKRTKSGCPFCNGTIPSGYWCKETCQIWLNDNMPDYKILDTAKKGSEFRVYIKCPVEDHEPYWTSWTHIRHEKTGCKQCYYDKNGKIDWTLDKAIEKFAQYGLIMLDEKDYKSSHESIYVKDKLGFIYQASIHFLLSGRTGFAMLRNNAYAVHNVKLFLKLYRPDYEFISTEYNQKKDMYLWKYLGKLPDGVDPIFEQTANAMLGAQCKHPNLSMSAFEAKCDFLLNKYGLVYETQKTFDGCIHKNKLRFDFYLELNGKKYCIETDGTQHEIPVEMYGGIEEFKERKLKDEIKNQYCKDNNIELIRIKYKNSKYMEQILVEKLNLGECVV